MCTIPLLVCPSWPTRSPTCAGRTGPLRFDDAAREVLQSDPAGVTGLDAHPDFENSVPTPDHFLPLLYIAGLADGEPLNLLIGGHAAGSISMAAYTLGLSCPEVATAGPGASADLPEDVPVADSNL